MEAVKSKSDYRVYIDYMPYEVKFVHLRKHFMDGQVNPLGGCSIAYIKHTDGSFSWAHAKLNDKKHFCYVDQRARALGKLQQRVLLRSAIESADEMHFRQQVDDLIFDFGWDTL